MEKVKNFLEGDLNYFEFGEKMRFDDPPSDRIWEKFEM